MLATKRQIAYLQELTDKVEAVRQKWPWVTPLGLEYKRWDIGMTSEKASLRIDYYNAILRQCYALMKARKGGGGV